ncbi:MAG: GNAT family N-acetyltransferase [Nanoarchaeota archaeon]
MIVRKATTRDANSLDELDRSAWEEIKNWSLQTKQNFKRSLKNQKFYFLIASEDKKDVGYLESEYDKEKDAVWLKNIYVLKKFRKKNIARYLIKKCCDYWKKKIDLILLLTADRNLEIFERLGFNKTMNYMVRIIK